MGSRAGEQIDLQGEMQTKNGGSEGKLPKWGAAVGYEQGNGMASKDARFATSIRHLLPVFSPFFFFFFCPVEH